jgi:hypothetical protein
MPTSLLGLARTNDFAQHSLLSAANRTILISSLFCVTVQHSQIGNRGILTEMSNLYCHPGRAGDLPFLISLHLLLYAFFICHVLKLRIVYCPGLRTNSIDGRLRSPRISIAFLFSISLSLLRYAMRRESQATLLRQSVSAHTPYFIAQHLFPGAASWPVFASHRQATMSICG